MRVSLSCSSERWRRVSFHHSCGTKALFFKRYAEKLASRRFVGLSVLQQYKFFTYFYGDLRRKVWQNIFNKRFGVARATPHDTKPLFSPGMLVAHQFRNMSQTRNKGPDI